MMLDEHLIMLADKAADLLDDTPASKAWRESYFKLGEKRQRVLERLAAYNHATEGMLVEKSVKALQPHCTALHYAQCKTIYQTLVHSQMADHHLDELVVLGIELETEQTHVYTREHWTAVYANGLAQTQTVINNYALYWADGQWWVAENQIFAPFSSGLDG